MHGALEHFLFKLTHFLAALQAAASSYRYTGLKPCALRGRAFSPEDATG
jgi:hypothetical protein